MENILEIDREYFLQICKESKTQEEARNKLNNMHIGTFKKYCTLFNIQKFRNKRKKINMIYKIFLMVNILIIPHHI